MSVANTLTKRFAQWCKRRRVGSHAAPRIASGFLAALLASALSLSAGASQHPGTASPCVGIDIRKAIHVAASREKVFGFWADYANFPRFMSRIREVRALEGRRSRWIAGGPSEAPMEWVSEITNVVPNTLIEWRTEPGSSVRHDGSVTFEPDGDAGTRVSVRLCYVPTAGSLGRFLAAASDPGSDMDEDLKRMKRLLETGSPA